MNHLHVSVSEELWYLPSLKHTCIEKAHTHSLEVINFYTTSCIQKLNVHIVMLHTSYWMFRLSVFNIIIMTLWNLTWHFDWEKVTLEKMPASEGGSGHRRLEPIPAIKQWERWGAPWTGCQSVAVMAIIINKVTVKYYHHIIQNIWC